MNQVAEQKRLAGYKAAEYMKDGMIIGLGTGSTAHYLVEALGQRVQNEHLDIVGVATSSRTQKQAEELGITMKSIDEVDRIDLTIDGADEIDENFQGIKGGGAAHMYEKIVASASTQVIWIVDQSKLVKTLGKFPLPLEVVPFGSTKVMARLEAENLHPKLRRDENGDLVYTHSHNYVVDLHLKEIKHPHLLANWLDHQVGIVEHGLFLDMVDLVIVGAPEGPQILPVTRN